MTIVTSRENFEQLMDLRMSESKLLLSSKNWDGSYYLVGYAVEFALKVRIISRLMASNGFPDKKLAENFYKHDLTLLRKWAELDEEMDKCSTICIHWDIVKDWNEQSRYEIGKTDRDATDMYEATEEVLEWIKLRW